jgi:hypothetical protein
MKAVFLVLRRKSGFLLVEPEHVAVDYTTNIVYGKPLEVVAIAW